MASSCVATFYPVFCDGKMLYTPMPPKYMRITRGDMVRSPSRDAILGAFYKNIYELGSSGGSGSGGQGWVLLPLAAAAGLGAVIACCRCQDGCWHRLLLPWGRALLTLVAVAGLGAASACCCYQATFCHRLLLLCS